MGIYTQILSLTNFIKPYTFDFMSDGMHTFTPNTLGWYLEGGKFILFDVDSEGTVHRFGSFYTEADATRFLFIHASAEAAEHCRLSKYACSHKYTRDEFRHDIAGLGNIKIVDTQCYQPLVYGLCLDINGYYSVFRNNASGDPIPTVYTACESDALNILRYLIQQFTIDKFS